MSTESTIKLEQLDSRIKSVWLRSQILHFSVGLLTFFRWSIPLFLLGVFIDWMTYMPSVGRMVMVIVLLLLSVYKAWRAGWCNLRSFNARHTALQIESSHGDLNSVLISALQFRESGDSNSLYNHTFSKAEEAAGGIQPEKTVPYNPLRKPGGIALALCGVIAVMTIMNSSFIGAGALRIFCPWVAIEYPTDTQIKLEKEELVIKEGESAIIQANLEGIIPEDAVILIRTGKGSAREIDLKVSDSKCEYAIASASRDFTYRIKAGDDRTDWHKVSVIPSPRVENVKVEISYPSYQSRKNISVEALNLTVPEGSELTWKVNMNRPISSATLIADSEKPVSLNVSEDGRQLTFTKVAAASSAYNFTWVEKEHGFKFTSPKYYLQVSSDQAPRVELTSPESNLVAMIGRPLKISARFQDDHGIGSATISYRLNQHDEKVVKLNTPSKNSKGEQPIDWDYRKVLTDLKVGDTLSFSLRVSDLYPGENGPHTVRSDTRRITFLSKEAYLEEIQKKRDLLLSKVQTIYRQQRSAFDSVRNLDPADGNYMQSCQMEAIRQEMLREQLKQIAKKFQSLIDDLAANGVSDAPVGDSLGQVRSELMEIADKHLANAASRLRHQSGVAASDKPEDANPLAAALTVNTAARELGSLVLLRSINTALEVFARESRMLAQWQISLRWRTVQSKTSETRSLLAKEQSMLVDWANELFTDLQNGMRYEKQPLHVLKLLRNIKRLQNGKVQDRMNQAGILIGQKQLLKAKELQTGVIESFLNAEFSVRLTGAFTTLNKATKQLRFLLDAQQKLLDKSAEMTAQNYEQAQAELRKELWHLYLPTATASRANLLDESFPKAPPIKALLKETNASMVEAMAEFKKENKESAISHQQKTSQQLTQLLKEVDKWSIDVGLKTMGLNTIAAAARDRLAIIEDFEVRVVELLEKTDITASENKKLESLLDPQSLLTEDIAAFNRDLEKQIKVNNDKDIAPLLSRTKRAEQVMHKALISLKKNDADQAIGQQEQAADIIAESLAIITSQNEQLDMLQNLLRFQKDVGLANQVMLDIVDQQKDLLKETEASTKENVTKLYPQLNNLKDSVKEVAPLLSMVASRLDVGTPLAFAQTDLGDAVSSLKIGDKFDSVDAQDVATESLDKVQKLVDAVKVETGYIAEMVEFLHNHSADLAMHEYQQEELKFKVAEAKEADLKGLVELQRSLIAQTEKTGLILETVTGGLPSPEDFAKINKDNPNYEPAEAMKSFTEPAKLMNSTLAHLQKGNSQAAQEEMELAGAALKENAESLKTVISMLHGLPSLEITVTTKPAIKHLVDVLAVTSEHKQLLRIVTDSDLSEKLSGAQDNVSSRLRVLIKAGEPHELLGKASADLDKTVSAMKSSNKEETRLNQKEAMQALQHFIIEQAILLDTDIEPGSSDGEGDSSEGSDTEAEFETGFIADFVAGEAPKDKRTGWNVLGERNRAALNQNFARELPLEYRGLLKNYYERVTK